MGEKKTKGNKAPVLTLVPKSDDHQLYTEALWDFESELEDVLVRYEGIIEPNDMIATLDNAKVAYQLQYVVSVYEE